MTDIKSEESLYVSRSRQRLEHLNGLTKIPTANSDAYTRWSRVRLDRILVDYMLREGFNETAGQLAREEGIEVGLILISLVNKESRSRTRSE